MKKLPDIIFIAFILLLTITIYFLTLSRSVYFGDSGEFITIAKTLGIAHPPGYPLYTLLSYLFTYLPFGTLAFKVNLFSAITSVLTVTVVFFIIFKLTANRAAAVIGSFLLAFSYHFWLYSLVAEVHSLNTFFIAVIILIAIIILKKPAQNLFYILALIFGLALTNHYTVLLTLPALLFLIFTTNPKSFFQIKHLIFAFSLFLVGLLPYLYLPIRASRNPVLNWGDPDTLGNFLNVLLRKDYGVLREFAGGGGLNFDGLLPYFSSLFLDFTGIGFLLGLLGCYFTFRANKKLFSFLFLVFLFLGPILILLTGEPVVNILTNAALEWFFSASQLVWSIFIGIGFVAIVTFLPKRAKVAGFIWVLLLPILIFFNYSKVNQSQNFLYESFGKQIFASLPENSIVLTFGDKISMISTYLQVAEQLRPDISFVKFTFLPDSWYIQSLNRRYPNLAFPYDKFENKQLTEVEAAGIICQEVASRNPTFIERQSVGFSQQNNPKCSYHPKGFLIKVENPAKEITIKELEKEMRNIDQKMNSKITSMNPFDLETRIVKSFYAESLTTIGRSFLNLRRKDLANTAFTKAQELSKDYALTFHLAALLEFDNKNFDKVIELEEKAIEAEPTLSQSYKILGLTYFNYKNDKTKTEYYLRKYFNTAASFQEKNEAARLMKELKSQPL